MLSKIFILFFVLLNFCCAQRSSDDSNVSQQIWVDYNPRWYLDTSYTIYGTVGARTVIPDVWTKLYLTSAVRFSPTSLFDRKNKLQQEFHGGLSIFYTFNKDKPDMIELRPFQGYKISWPNLKNLKVSHFLRLEERFEFTSGQSDMVFDLRARYKLEGIIHWTKHLVDFADGLYIPISVEYFVNLYSTKQFNNAIRFTSGVGYSTQAQWKVQFDLSYQAARNEEESNFTINTIIYRLRFFQAI